jgi:hypothetical protein
LATAESGGSIERGRGQKGFGNPSSLSGPEWAWIACGIVTIVIARVLNANLGGSLATVRPIVAVWILITAGVAAWRWKIDPERSPFVLAVSLIGLSAAAILSFGAALPLIGIKWTTGLFWIAAGILELIASSGRMRPVLQSPWISAGSLFAGLVTITFPSVLVVEFTFVAVLWALVLGICCLVRGGWLAYRSRRPAPTGSSRIRRGLSIAIPAILLIAPILGYANVMANMRAADGRQAELAAFYDAPANLAPGDPGSIIRAQRIAAPDVHGTAWRVLYRSEDENSRPTVSSGLIFAPPGAGSDRPVIAWAHGTAGLGPTCAPSRGASPTAHADWINDALDRGWVVAATDYAGAAGTGAGEKYLVIAEQGRDVLNSVRAAKALPDTGAGDRFATYGESQGGLISLAAGSLAPTYAPELHLVGIGGVASASDTGSAMEHAWDRPLVGWLLGTHLVRAWTQQYPNLDADSILSEAGREHYQEVADDSCIFDIVGAIINPRMGPLFGKDPTTDPAWHAAFLANRAPLPPQDAPVFIGHGLADPLIDPAFSAGVVERYCAAGASVMTHWMAGVQHIDSSIVAAPTYLQWVADLLSGGQAPSNCGDPLPITPAPEFH